MRENATAIRQTQSQGLKARLTWAALALLAAAASQAVVLRVAPNGDGSNGSTWGHAYPTISRAVAVATGPTEIWVAQGTYFDSVTIQTAGIAIDGGFAGDETTRDARHGGPTIVDGQSANRPFKFFYADNCTLDGFTVQNGGSMGFGGGVYSYYCNSLTLSNCTVQDCTSLTGNNGGGISITMGSATLTNLTIRRCWTAAEGGGIELYNPTIAATGLNISACTALRGGGLKLEAGTGSILTSVFTGNVATSTGAEGGGAVRLTSVARVVLGRSLFYGNTANYGSAIDAGTYTTAEISNNVVTSNHALTSATIFIHGTSTGPNLYNNVVADNAADSGPTAYLVAEGAFTRFRSEIVAFNQGVRGAIAKDAVSSYQWGYSDVWQNAVGPFDDKSDPAASAMDFVDPQFMSRTFLNNPLSYIPVKNKSGVAPKVWDYGQNGLETVDFLGAPRPIKSRLSLAADEGPFEYQAVEQHAVLDVWSGPNVDGDQSTTLLTVTVKQNGTVVAGATEPMSFTGFYVLPGGLAAGSGPYDVSFTAKGYLRRTIHVQSLPAYGATGVDCTLLCGDANGDNQVDLVDLSTVLAAVGSTGSSSADLNGDGVVGLSDLSIIVSNFSLHGD